MIEPCSGVGEFLEDLTLQGTKFDLWLQRLRANPAEIDELLGSSPPAVPASLTPTIAAIPFRLVQGDKTHRFLGDWLAEEICRVMSRSRLLSVISHLSTRSFANRAFDIAGIRRDLKVDYCLVGSIRVSGDRIALNVDLIDTKTGRILWDREFESSIDAIRNLSDCMGQIVSVAVGRTIVKESIAAALSAQPSEVDTCRLIIAGVNLMHRQTLRNFTRGRLLLEEAIRRAPKTSELHAWLAKWYVFNPAFPI
jgi:TolB-like protein